MKFKKERSRASGRGNDISGSFWKMTYKEFLQSKVELATDSGFAVDPEHINRALKPHQRDAVMWALKGGRRALFESFGLGKTVQEIEFCHQAAVQEGGQALVVMPLGVRQEFTRDASEVLGYEIPAYCRTMDEVKAAGSEIILTNYERVRDGDIDPSYFAASSLDEASVLRSFGSKTYQTFLDKFRNVPYKLVATATPSPNRYKELIHYAGYLEVMDTGQALTRFFQRDSTKANNLTLYPNMEDEFWLWVSSWALFVTRPSDLSPDYPDEGYDLPPLDVRWHELPVHYGDTADRDGQMQLFQEAAEGLKEAAAVKRNSIDARVAEMKRIVDESPDDNFLLWHDLESERHEIKKALPETVDIYGSQDYGLREQRVIDFSDGKIRLFATKKSLSGSGCNFQRYCHREIFLGIDYEFNDFIQAVHRCYRFLQKEPVVIDIIYMENERQIREALIDKWKNHDYMVARMIEIVKKYGLNTANKAQRLDEPIMTVDGSNRYGLVTSFLHKYYDGGYTGAGESLENPLPTVTAVDHNSVCAATLIQMNNHCDGRNIAEPIPTITAGDGHFGEVRAFLIKYYGQGTGQDAREPLDTIPTHDRFGLVTIAGVDYQIVDIGLRMLEPKELYGCQGFPDDYIIDHDYTGRTYPRSEQVRRCGNAVCPPIPAALVRANLPELCRCERTKNMKIEPEQTGQLRFA